MAAPKWFDYATYKTNKLAQLQQLDSSWNMTKMEDAFTKAGFTGTEGYYAHFQKYGHTEDVSPNKLFSADYYYKAKALQFYTSEAGGSIDEATVQDKLDYYAQQVKGLINNAGMDAWTHYIKYGTAEGINPSNSFDTEAYMAAKLQALQAAEPDAGWTEETMNAAFKKAGLNALEHFMVYAGNGNANEVAEGMGADGSVPEAYAVPDDEKIDDGGTGTTFTLTADSAVLTNSANVNATPANSHLSSGDDTVNAFNFLDTATVEDPSTTDSDMLTGYVNGGFAGSIKNIETVKLTFKNKVVFDATKASGVKEFDISSDVALESEEGLTNIDTTAGDSVPLVMLSGSNDLAVGVTTLAGTSDVLNVGFDSFNGKFILDDATDDATPKLETLNMTVKGESTVSDFALTLHTPTIGKIVATGDGSVKFTAITDGVWGATIEALTKGDDMTGSVGLVVANNADDALDLAKLEFDSVTLGTTAQAAADEFAITNSGADFAVDVVNGVATGLTVTGTSDVQKSSSGSDKLTITAEKAVDTLALADTGYEVITVKNVDSALTLTPIHTDNPKAEDSLLLDSAKDITVVGDDLAFDTLDGSAMTGKLIMDQDGAGTACASQIQLSTIKGGAGADTLYVGRDGAIVDGGAKADIITVVAGVVSTTLTGGAGNDTFNVTAAVAGGQADAFTAFTTITDFSTGENKLAMAATVTDVEDLTSGANVSALKATATDAEVFAAIRADAATALADTTAYFAEVNGSTYIQYCTADTGLDATADTMVKLTGVTGGIEVANNVITLSDAEA